MDDPRDPSLETVLELHREVLLDGIHVMLPGRIVSYDQAKQTATVQPLVKARHLAEDGETLVIEDVAPINGCLVRFVGPARGRMTWPVAAGDICEIRFASASLARWCAMASGPTIDPGDDRRHNLTDAICVVGMHSPANPPTDAPTDAVVIHVSDGTKIRLGGSSSAQSVPQGDNLQSALNTLMTALKVYIAGIKSVADPSDAFTTTLGAAIDTFEAAGYLSDVVKID